MNLEVERKLTQEVLGVLRNAAAMSTLEGAARYLSAMLPEWYIYRGGCHVAVHLRRAGAYQGPRYAIIME